MGDSSFVTKGLGDDALLAIDALIDDGRLGDAWARLGAGAENDRDPEVAWRVARVLRPRGAPTRARRALLAAWRHDPRSVRARLGAEYVRFELRGPFEVWESLRDKPIEGPSAVERLELVELEARIAAALRDFDAAESHLRSLASEPARSSSRAEIAVEIRAAADDLEGAAALAQSLVSKGGPNASFLRARILWARGERGAAIDLLVPELRRTEEPRIFHHALGMLLDEGRAREAADLLPALAAIAVHAEPEVQGAVERLRSEVARRVELSPAVGPGRRRVPLPYVHQAHLTCVPAVLTALARSFGRAVSQGEIVEAICYSGTPAHSERHWLEAQGFFVREFTLTWDAVVELIDRGLPFGLSIHRPGRGHAQAVIGYDAGARRLVLRDPGLPLELDLEIDLVLRDLGWLGPRCIVAVPIEQASRVPALPDTELHDLLYEVESALEAHERDRAVRARDELVARVPEHRLAWLASRALLAYDGDVVEFAESARARARALPDDPMAAMDALVGEGEAKTDRIARAEAALSKHGDVFFALALARELSAVPASRDRAERLARRSLRREETNATGLGILARLVAAKGEHRRAQEILHLAACANIVDDGAAFEDFVAKHVAGKTDDGLAMLERRFGVARRRSGRPALVLVAALSGVGRFERAREVAEEARRARPVDGELLLGLVEAALRDGRISSAWHLVSEAEGHARSADLWSAKALVLEAEGAPPSERRAAWDQVLHRAPFDLRALAKIASLIRESRGAAAAREWLSAISAERPHHRAVAQYAFSWLLEGPREGAEYALRAHLRFHPDDSVARTMLAESLFNRGIVDDALEQATLASTNDPSHREATWIRLRALEELGKPDALADCDRAFRDDPDGPFGALLVALTPPANRTALLAEIAAFAVTRTLDGSGVVTVYRALVAHLDDSAIRLFVDTTRSERPELLVGWQLGVGAALAAADVPRALQLALEMTARFGGVAAAWEIAAFVHRISGDEEAMFSALEKRLACSAVDETAFGRLVDAYDEAGRSTSVDEWLERAGERYPSTRARVLAGRASREGRSAEALALLGPAIERSPDRGDLWEALAGIGGEEAATALRDLATRFPGEPIAQITSALARSRAGDVDAALAILERALADAPRSSALLTTKLDVLVASGRLTEAHALARAEARTQPSFAFATIRLGISAGDPAATARLEAFLRRESGFGPAWETLAIHGLDRGALAESLRASRVAALLCPGDALPHLALGFARLGTGARRSGFESLRIARTLVRSRAEVTKRVFTLALEDGLLTEASAAFASLASEQTDAELRPLRAELEVARGDVAAAGATLAEAARDAAVSQETLSAIRNALVLGGHGGVVEDVFVTLSVDPEASEVAGRVWASARCLRDGWAFVVTLTALDPSHPFARGAAFAFCGVLGRDALDRDYRRVVRILEPWLARDSVAVGALAVADGGRHAVWRGVRRTRGAVFLPNAHRDALHAGWSLRARAGLEKQARRLLEASRARFADDPIFAAIAAFDAALAERHDEAAALLSVAERGSLTDDAQSLALLARALVMTGPPSRPLEEVLPILRHVDRASPRHRHVRRALERTRHRLALRARSFRPYGEIFAVEKFTPYLGVSLMGAFMLYGAYARREVSIPEDGNLLVTVLILGAIGAFIVLGYFGSRALWRAILARL